MQNKGTIRVFAIIFAFICLYQLSFTVVTYIVDSKANKFATNETIVQRAKELAGDNPARERFIFDSLSNIAHQYFIDSVSSIDVYNILIAKYTYKECKEREINLGLDLRGGMNVVMEVSTSDVVNALSSFSTDRMFNEVMEKAIAENKITPNSNFVDIFAKVWNETDPNAQMAAIFSYEMKTINATSSNDDVVQELKKEVGSAYDRTYEILRNRIDKFGVAQPNVQKLTQTERILIELPGVKEPERVRKLLQGTAQLEFWETYQFGELVQNLQDANDLIASLTSLTDSATSTEEEVVEEEKDTTSSLLADMEGASASTDEAAMEQEDFARTNPLFTILMPSQGGEEVAISPVVGYSQAKDITRVNEMLEQAKSKFPRNLRWVWSAKPVDDKSDIYMLLALRVSTRDGRAPITGEVVTDARQDYSQNGGVEISMSMNSEGARLWKNLTGANIGRAVAIVLDNYAYSWPNVNVEISGGRSSITGGFTIEEGQDLANILKAGKLPAPARIVQEAVVGPSLGQQAISAGLFSFLLAFIMILLYMLFFYNKAGLVANVALLVNVFFLVGVLASLGAVLTLPGIAGIVLTLGMAVDANVIIYERIKEEIAAGKGIRLAVADGYKASYSAIIDGNVTTLLTAIVLYIFGTGPIQGFATTLAIGILTSVFTSIFISRLVFEAMLSRKANITFDNKFVKNFLKGTSYNIIGKRKISYSMSLILVIISISTLTFRGLDLGIDFTGGRTYVVRFDENVSTQEVRSSLATAFGEAPEVKTFGPSNQVKIATQYLVDETGSDIEMLVEEKLYAGVKDFYQNEISFNDFNDERDGKVLGKLSSELIGPTMATDITRSAIIAVVIALFVIFAYIALRFKKWQYGLGGAVALAHNTIITMGIFAGLSGILPFNMEVDQAFVAAILTIIGYAINDTVVIFDRIRENVVLFPKHSLFDTMNKSFNETLTRTFNTSMTTLVVLIMIFIFGGEVIRGFVFSIIVGIILGTYSSMFIASPIAYNLLSAKKKGMAVAKK